MLNPHLPGFFGDVLVNPLADRVPIERRLIQTGHLPLEATTSTELDRVLGSVLEYADGSFNTILELGFGSSITREWAWRTSRGESTANLEAFRHLAPPAED